MNPSAFTSIPEEEVNAGHGQGVSILLRQFFEMPRPVDGIIPLSYPTKISGVLLSYADFCKFYAVMLNLLSVYL